MRPQSTPAEAVTLADLENDPHPALARLRAASAVCWVPVLDAWLVTGYELAVGVLRDSRTFTVDDPRFSTAKVVGPSMLSLDGAQHARHRGPFNRPFRHDEIRAHLASFAQAEADRLVSAIQPRGEAEIRRAVAGPLAVTVMAEALGLGQADPARVLTWYDGIVAAVQAEAASAAHPPGDDPVRDAGPARESGSGREDDATATASSVGAAAFAELAASLRQAIAAPRSASLLAEVAGPQAEVAGRQAEVAGRQAEVAGRQAEVAGRQAGAVAGRQAGAVAGRQAGAGGPLTEAEVISNAAVLMFGGIETTEGMITNAMQHLLSYPGELALIQADRGLIPAAIDESLRLEPAAAVVDRYATTDAHLGGAFIRAGDQVTVSITGANRDPAVFDDPDRFDIRRPNAARHLAFAHGPHFCLGAHLARLETEVAIETLLDRLPHLKLDLDYRSAPRGLVFRKPAALRVRWNVA